MDIDWKNLLNWFFYSVVIPVEILVLRVLLQILFHGPENIKVLAALSNSEITFLAAVLIAGALGQSSGYETSNSKHLLRPILITLLIPSVAIAGLTAPLEPIDIGSNPPSLSAMNSIWCRTEGREFFTRFNLALLVLVFLIVLIWELSGSIRGKIVSDDSGRMIG